MALPKIKTTYSLDEVTVRTLEQMAQRWQVSKSEALRRAIRIASAAEEPDTAAVEVLDRLQGAVELDADAADRWTAEARAERRASSRRRESS